MLKKIKGVAMQGMDCSLSWYLKPLLFVFFLSLMATCGMYAAAAAEALYPANEDLEDTPVVLDDFMGEIGMATSDYSFRYCELYRGLGVNYNTPQDEINVIGRQLIGTYNEVVCVSKNAHLRLGFIMNALAILAENRREYNRLLYLWMHPDSSLDNPALIAFVDAYTLVDRK